MVPRELAAAVLALAAWGCTPNAPARSQGGPPAAEWFVDEAHASGLEFVHVNGMSGQLYMTEVLSPGVALVDYDGDGDLDVYLIQGQPLAPGRTAQPSGDRLFRNELTVGSDGSRRVHFTDVTAASGLRPLGYGMGVAAGDVDNDGDVDLYLTKFDAENELWRNNGNGTFTDWSKRSGTNQRAWGTSAAFVDVNRDGWLDLFVANYIRYDLTATAPCFSATGARDYCTPDAFQPLPDRLYLNRRDGTFSDVSAAAGVAHEFGPALGVATADFNGDGWMDIYVANDGKENLLWQNRGNGTFQNVALRAGVALPASAKAEASMGVDAGDFDDDGDDDLVMTELSGEGSNLFVNDGAGVFSDRSTPSGVGLASMPLTGFGTGWIDVDHDGRLDLFAVNGTVQVIERQRQANDPLPLRQPKLVFRNLGNGRFEDVTMRAGRVLAEPEVGRGLALGDVDNDGRVDVLVGNNSGPARLLMNRAPAGHWLGLRLVGVGGRDMLGTRVEVSAPGETTRWRRARSDGSYASASDPRVVVGLGESDRPRTVRVVWPSGKVEMWPDVPVDRYTTLVEGQGQ